jgi:hypothetical protein
LGPVFFNFWDPKKKPFLGPKRDSFWDPKVLQPTGVFNMVWSLTNVYRLEIDLMDSN